ncbi:MAG: riboflavin synthase [Kiritimatiellae bacterium]|nr:riboflavin synthase [Kiritimatiellia bacterium]
MFTGLVGRRGTWLGLSRGGGGAVARLGCPPWPDGPLEPGESVAVQGCCLTVAAVRPDGFDADVLDETLRATALGDLAPGAAANLERALRVSGRLGGHLVQGHVDATARLEAVDRAGRDWRLRLRLGGPEARYVVYKGSVALDGVSLTVSAVPAPGVFEVNVIPTTWRETSLSERRPGDRLNVETDVVARYVESLLAAPAGRPVTMELLRKAGFAGAEEN